MGRRLIRFKREQVGNKLFVSCEVIPEEAYNEDDIVISCIRRAETRTCWFTSVDVIYLLERLVGSPFSTEEKNRIRRNLEGFKPTTVSKHKPGMDAFFQRIMDFPPPKPRNIEKDVKVFPWSVLGNALDKIIQKYVSLSTHFTAWFHPQPHDSLLYLVHKTIHPHEIRSLIRPRATNCLPLANFRDLTGTTRFPTTTQWTYANLNTPNISNTF